MTDGQLFDGYGPVAGYDEMYGQSGVRDVYAGIHAAFERMPSDEVRQRAEGLASSYLEQGITFGVAGEERPFPLDIVPRIIEAEAWDHV